MNAFMSNADHAAMVDGDILLFSLPQSAYIYRKSRTAHAPSNFLEVGVRLLETGEDAAIGDRNFRSRLYKRRQRKEPVIHIGATFYNLRARSNPRLEELR